VLKPKPSAMPSHFSWLGQSIMLRVESSFTPVEGTLINIKQTTYRITGVSFSVDHADRPFEAQMRCNVIMEVLL